MNPIKLISVVTIMDEEVIMACSRDYYQKNMKEDIINTISLVQLLDKVPTLTEKVFAKFLINTIQKMKAHPRKN